MHQTLMKRCLLNKHFIIKGHTDSTYKFLIKRCRQIFSFGEIIPRAALTT